MRKILVLEDEATIREFVVINLRRSGYTVVEAETGEMALELLRAPAAAHLPATIPPAVLSACPAKNA